MIGFVGLFAFLGGVIVLIDYFFPGLTKYPLIYFGVGFSFFAALIDYFRKKKIKKNKS